MNPSSSPSLASAIAALVAKEETIIVPLREEVERVNLTPGSIASWEALTKRIGQVANEIIGKNVPIIDVAFDRARKDDAVRRILLSAGADPLTKGSFRTLVGSAVIFPMISARTLDYCQELIAAQFPEEIRAQRIKFMEIRPDETGATLFLEVGGGYYRLRCDTEGLCVQGGSSGNRKCESFTEVAKHLDLFETPFIHLGKIRNAALAHTRQAKWRESLEIFLWEELRTYVADDMLAKEYDELTGGLLGRGVELIRPKNPDSGTNEPLPKLADIYVAMRDNRGNDLPTQYQPLGIYSGTHPIHLDNFESFQGFIIADSNLFWMRRLAFAPLLRAMKNKWIGTSESKRQINELSESMVVYDLPNSPTRKRQGLLGSLFGGAKDSAGFENLTSEQCKKALSLMNKILLGLELDNTHSLARRKDEKDTKETYADRLVSAPIEAFTVQAVIQGCSYLLGLYDKDKEIAKITQGSDRTTRDTLICLPWKTYARIVSPEQSEKPSYRPYVLATSRIDGPHIWMSVAGKNPAQHNRLGPADYCLAMFAQGLGELPPETEIPQGFWGWIVKSVEKLTKNHPLQGQILLDRNNVLGRMRFTEK